MLKSVLLRLLVAIQIGSTFADWPMLRGSPSHTGFTETSPDRPFHLKWAVEFSGERIGTAVEPIVAEGKVFVTTHAGTLYALNEKNGEALWKFEANGAFLHSPGCSHGRVVAASVDGCIYALEAGSGKLQWQYPQSFGGFSAAPIIAEGKVFIGSRAGEMIALDLANGTRIWSASSDVPIRQTAAWSNQRLYVTAEDLSVRCYNSESGALLWRSERLSGQTARDYYPVIVESGTNIFVITRTNPLLNMGQRIGRDRTLLCRHAGVDDSSWQKLDAWIKSDAARGTPQLWEQEQNAIIEYLRANPDAETFTVLDANTGQKPFLPPVLWIGGCQGVGPMPALMNNGKVLVFYRSAYGNWNHGVAPLVSLGSLDLPKNQITPLFHRQGKQPPWNCFWGTADESQNFAIAGHTLFIVHQGTLSGFDLATNDLFPIWGERDTYGGFRNPSWARNEWHGPARSGIALSSQQIFWQTGSRILCVQSGAAAKSAEVKTINPSAVRSIKAPTIDPLSNQQLREKLESAVDQFLQNRWAPLFVDPGLAGRDFSFDESKTTFEALTAVFQVADQTRKKCIREFLENELQNHPPFTSNGFYSLAEGEAREWYQVPSAYRARLGADPHPQPFGGLASAWAWANASGSQTSLLTNHWREINASFGQFQKTNWRLDAAKGDLFANRYISSLFAFAEIATRAGETNLASHARQAARTNFNSLVAWWKGAAQNGTLRQFKTSSELDPFINRGDAISFKIVPHRHKIALFRDLTPDLFADIRQAAPEAVAEVWRIFSEPYKTWPLQGEERQVHFGENFVDPPDLAAGAFKVLLWSKQNSRDRFISAVDLPFCRADLYYLEKLALALVTNE